ncbi:MAG: FAD-dependent oxidoreductase [Ruminococcaceae bacterium]|nr:FAD-dependent oxidoreductase [Oscillospiraceae bacterium]
MKRTSYEIVVVGGGFAGACAAIAAARRGRDVLLIEKYNCLGGAAVYDLVNPFMGNWTRDPEKPDEIVDLSCGMFLEIVARMEKMGGCRYLNGITFNEEILKYVFNQMAVESGVHLLYGTYVTDVKTDAGRIVSVTASNVSGSCEIEAECFIDATGDANLSYLAGCSYRVGRASDGLCQPMTLCFRLGNVQAPDKKDFKVRINRLYKQYYKEGRFRNPRENILVFDTLNDNVMHFNTTRVVKMDPTDAEDVTRAEIEAREQVFELYDFLRTNFEECKDSILLSTGLQIGARESRMIDGEYLLTAEDLLSFASFPDSIAVCNYDIDIHSPDGSGTSHYYFPNGKYYQIPYRALIPRGVSNLLVAGRCISATHEAQASVRIMPTCSNLGEAAGLAASLCVRDKAGVRDINIGELQSLLVENGARID